MEISANILRLIEDSRAAERSGEIAAALQQAGQARLLAQEQGDAEGEASALNALAYAHIRLGHYPLASELCRDALSKCRGESPARAEALLTQGICAGETNDLTAAEQFFQQAVDLSRQVGDDRVLVRGLHALACGIYMPRGQFALSLASDEEALNIARLRGLPELIWGPLLTMSWVYWLTGQRQFTESGLEALHAAVSPGSLGDGYWHFLRASLALESGDVGAARTLFTATLSIAEANGVAENRFYARLGLSRLHRVLDEAPAAWDWAGDALSIVEHSGYRHLQGQALIERARAAWGMANLRAAEDDLRAAIERLAPLQLNFDRALAHLLLAALLHQQQRPDAAAARDEAANRLAQGGFGFLADRERALAFPLLAAGLNSPDSDRVGLYTGLVERLQAIPPPTLQISTLGGWRIAAGARVIEKSGLRQRRSGELLGLLLAQTRRRLTVEQIVEALWPDKSPAAAQAIFHQATSALRRLFEPDLPEKFPSRYLIVEDGLVTLRLPPGSSVDYEAFELACRNGEWRAALGLYGGEFLPEYPYADWAISLRQRLLQHYQRALLAAAEEAVAGEEWDAALETCQQVLAIEPWQEQAALLGMRASLGLGDRAGARRWYLRLEKTLRADLGVEPQAELQALFRSL